MPHECTSCGRTFPDGSKEMLSGCPDCGGNKFQFRPSGAPPAAGAAPPSDPREDRAQADARSGFVAGDELPVASREAASRGGPAVGPERETADRQEASRDPDESGHGAGDRVRPDPKTDDPTAETEGSPAAETEGSPAAEPDEPPGDSGSRPDIDELRAELNDQFESIRIVSPGEYELNLMELYDRQEYIISLQEDGRYMIEMPDAWGTDDG